MNRKYFVLALTVFFVLGVATDAAADTITWDGGGTTNNWSEAANWGGDVVPGPSDNVIFDATSSKDATVDTNITVSSIYIMAGYGGTLTQSDPASITVTGCSGRPCFKQDGGTFNGSSNTITLNSSGSAALTMNGGTFNGGSGDISITGQGADISLQGGTFTSTSGNLSATASFRFQGTSVFIHNGGTVTINVNDSINAFVNDSNHPSVTFNNLVYNNSDGSHFDFFPRTIVEGNLTLNDGTIGPNGGVIEARGSVLISPNFDGGNLALEFAGGSGPRTVTLSTDQHLPKIVLDDPNVTVNTSGNGTLVLPHQLVIRQGTFNQGSVDLLITPLDIGGGACLVMSGGILNGSSNAITLNSNGSGTVSMTGGTFNGGSGNIMAVGDAVQANHDIQINGGLFRSTSGILFVSRSFRVQNDGGFLNNGGTVIFNSGMTPAILSDDGHGGHPSLVFNNATFAKDSGSVMHLIQTSIIVNGTLSLSGGEIDGTGGLVIDAFANVNIDASFEGITDRVALRFSGLACQTVTLNGIQNFPGDWEVNKTGCGITAIGNFGVHSIIVSQGSLIIGNGSHANLAGDLMVDPNGVVTIGSGTAFDAGNGQIGGTLELPGADSVVNIGSGVISGILDITGLDNTVNLGSLTVDPGGQYLADNTGTIILGGDVINNGLINLRGYGSECLFGGGTFITIQSSVAGTTRNWSGTGVFHMVHLNVSDMGGTAAIHVHNGVTDGTTGANWTFDSNCSANALHTPFDFDGDGKSDIAIFRPSTATWYLHKSVLGDTATHWGLSTDILTPADFDGDGITDIAVWRPADLAHFFVLNSATSTVTTEQFGQTGDDPIPVADWDGDGKADIAVYRNAAVGNQSFFYFRGSRNNPNGNTTYLPWGQAGDDPVRGDFDGDGIEDATVFRPSDRYWYTLRSSDQQTQALQWGLITDKRIEGDFDGDGKTDLAVFRPSDATWYILQSSDGQPRYQQWGLSTDVPVPGDYDGDGKTDFAIWRPSDGNFWQLLNDSGQSEVLNFGIGGDVPIASSFVR